MTNKKSKKRASSEADVVPKPVADKKKKVENQVVENGQANKGVKAPKAASQVKAAPQNKGLPQDKAQAPVQKDTKKVANKKDTGAVKVNAEAKEKKTLEKMKARQAFREKRKQKRQETGQHYIMSLNLSVEQLKEKIQEIQNRPSITKTAKRKLAILRKKLSIEEGTELPTQVPEKAKAAQQQQNAKNAKKGKPGKVSVTDGAENTNNKSKVAEAAKKKQVQNNEGQNKKVQPGKANAKPNKPNNKKNANQGSLLRIKQSEKVEEESEDEDEDDDDEDETELETSKEIEEDEEEDDVEDEEDDEDDDEEVSDEEDEEGDDDEDEDDDDDEEEEDEEEDETEVPSTVPEKVKGGPQAKKQKLNEEQSTDEAKNQTGKKQRYVLFVGNLPYTATVEDIKKHFLTKVSSVTDVRIPTKPGTKQSRGFAYVELANNIDYEKALALDQSFLNGRKINVQYSASGSKSAGNKKEVIAKNLKLHALRKAGKLAGGNQTNNRTFAGKKGKPNFGATKT